MKNNKKNDRRLPGAGSYHLPHCFFIPDRPDDYDEFLQN